MLKNKKLAYDGRGNAVVRDANEIEAAFNRLGKCDIYAEKWCPFTKELAVMVVRTSTGLLNYPVVETIQKNSICDVVIAPALLPYLVAESAVGIAREAVEHFEGYGIFGVEMFLLPDDSIIINEIAPRYCIYFLYFVI